MGGQQWSHHQWRTRSKGWSFSILVTVVKTTFKWLSHTCRYFYWKLTYCPFVLRPHWCNLSWLQVSGGGLFRYWSQVILMSLILTTKAFLGLCLYKNCNGGIVFTLIRHYYTMCCTKKTNYKKIDRYSYNFLTLSLKYISYLFWSLYMYMKHTFISFLLSVSHDTVTGLCLSTHMNLDDFLNLMLRCFMI